MNLEYESLLTLVEDVFAFTYNSYIFNEVFHKVTIYPPRKTNECISYFLLSCELCSIKTEEVHTKLSVSTISLWTKRNGRHYYVNNSLVKFPVSI